MDYAQASPCLLYTSGPKAYEQCAGFLRLPEAKNRRDATAVHPESYTAAKALLDALSLIHI